MSDPVDADASTGLWNPERLRALGDIMTRYGRVIQPGHRIRLDVRGDTCRCFRAAEDGHAARGVVKHVVRRPIVGCPEEEYVSFTVQMDGTDATIELDNANIHRPWEIDPDDAERFRASVTNPSPNTIDRLSAVEKECETLRRRLQEEVKDVRSLIAETTRQVAEDVIGVASGEDAAFSRLYAGAYDDVNLPDTARYEAGEPEEPIRYKGREPCKPESSVCTE